MSADLLEVDRLSVVYRGARNSAALSEVTFRLREREILGVVGESGCGKSTLASTVIRLLPPNAEIVGGNVQFDGSDILGFSAERMRDLRGPRIAMIFQDPLTSLNPSFTIGRQLVDVQRAHTQSVSRREVRRRALEVLVQVGIPDAAERLEHYPHEFSGGMRQRIMIAMALVLEPALLIADEPTSSLDVTLRAQILALLRRLRDEHGTAILLISHDLDVVEQICDRMLVMYAGRPVEYGDVPVVLAEPRHPYTKALLWARPSVGRRGAPLKTIPGRVPSLADLPRGCAFCGRCSEARLTCHRDAPRYLSVDQRYVRCHVYDPDSDYLASPAGSPVPQEGVE